MLVRSGAGRTAARGHGADVFSPRTASHALGARVGHVFVATSLKVTVTSAGFAGANRRRPKNVFSEGDRVFRAACPTVLSAGRAATACPRRGDTDVPSPAPRGPRPFGHRRRCPILQGRPARGRRRFAPPRRPSREQLSPRTCLCKDVCLLLHDACAQPDDRRWTRRRPSSGSPDKGLQRCRAGRF